MFHPQNYSVPKIIHRSILYMLKYFLRIAVPFNYYEFGEFSIYDIQPVHQLIQC